MNIQLLVLRYVVTMINVHFCACWALSKTKISTQTNPWWQSTERHCSQTLVALPQSMPGAAHWMNPSHQT